jgi:hypothetical protein
MKSGFRDGFPGLVIIVSTMSYVFVKYAKLWELMRGNRNEPEEGQGEKG